MRLRDELGVFYQDEEFADLYPDRGQSAIAPWRLVMILIMQFLENLSDRQTADAVRGRIDWKYALSLELEDDGFDFSVLSEFRTRLIAGGISQQILDKMLAKFGDLGLLKSREKARTESTHILAVVQELTKLEHLEETLKSALNTLAKVAPTWLERIVTVDWYERYIFSPDETEARKSIKRSTKWTSYKVHLTETCEEDLPHLITHVETTVATTQDSTVVPSIHQALAEKEILPQHI